jgi:hypothetical protein
MHAYQHLVPVPWLRCVIRVTAAVVMHEWARVLCIIRPLIRGFSYGGPNDQNECIHLSMWASRMRGALYLAFAYLPSPRLLARSTHAGGFPSDILRLVIKREHVVESNSVEKSCQRRCVALSAYLPTYRLVCNVVEVAGRMGKHFRYHLHLGQRERREARLPTPPRASQCD